jgi:hypothetical protein
MKQKHASSSNYPLILVLAGIITYIAVDAGVFGFAKSIFQNKNVKNEENVKTTQESLLAYSRKLNGELSGVDKEIQTEKKKLHALREQVAAYESNMAKQKKSLSELDKEIKALSNLKTALSTAQERVTRQEKRKAGLESETRKLAAVRPIWTAAPASFDELAEAIQSSTKLEAIVEPIKYGVGEFIRLKSAISYGDGSIYLTHRGTQQASIFAEGAKAMGYDTVKLAYYPDDSMLMERAGVIKRYLNEKFGDKISVSTIEVRDDLELTDGLEVWAAKGSEQ